MSNSQFTYPCGCCFATDVVDNKKSLVFDTNIDNINLGCSKTWDIIASGNTKGIFQLESRLGRSIAKKLKPENIDQLSALIAILRPGTLEAYRDGKSVTQHYIDKKNGLESIDYFHPSLEPILKSTLGELIYQEQAMRIASDIAGFTLQEADELRKAIGKKLADKMAQVKEKFIDGCNKLKIVTNDEALQIFGWIEKSQRYLFNASHSVSYAMNAYLSAYAKSHFTKIFFASYLKFAKDKMNPQEEIKALVQNANEMDITVSTPDIRLMNQNFVLKHNKIYFGLTDIKGFGDSVFSKLKNIIDSTKINPYESWLTTLFNVLLNINSVAAKSLIESGSVSFLGKSRNSMLFELNIAQKLTNKEIEFILGILDNAKTLKDCLCLLKNKPRTTKNRLKAIDDLIVSINNPPYSLQDTPEWIADVEDSCLGCSITCSKLDLYDISMCNCSCRDFKNGKQKSVIIGGEIDYINVTKTKTGKSKGSDMCFVNLTDQTGSIDNVIFFPEQYKKHKNLLFQGNIVILFGDRSKSGDGLIVEKAYVART